MPSRVARARRETPSAVEKLPPTYSVFPTVASELTRPLRLGVNTDEIAPVTIKGRKGDTVVADDEYIRAGATIDSVSGVRPAFKKDGTITIKGKDINLSTLGTVPSATTAANAGSWAIVNNGVLLRNRGASSVTPLGGAVYQVTFNQNVSQCAYVATAGNVAAGNDQTAAQITVRPSGNSVNAVTVKTYDAAGNATARDFFVMVMC